MHHIYHTEGIILWSKNYGEAGKYYALLTRNLGMVYASAQGVRKISSKLRFILQDFSYAKVDLVRGKDFWRITSASKTNKLENIKKEEGKLLIFANIANLLKRLLAGEEANTVLFEDLLNGMFFLEKSKMEKDWQVIEMILVLRILFNLGYFSGLGMPDGFVKLPYGVDLIEEVKNSKKTVLSEINKALKETHL